MRVAPYARNASAAVEPYRILKLVAGANAVAMAVDGAAPLLGVSDGVGAIAQGGVVDSHEFGNGKVRAGGEIALNDPLTSDANGKAVKADPAAGANIHIIGWALEPAADDDIFDFKIAPSILQGEDEG